MGKLLPVRRGGVIINTMDPGLCKTTLSRNSPPERKARLKKTLEDVGRSAECGSRTLLAGVVGDEETHGSYMSDCIVAE